MAFLDDFSVNLDTGDIRHVSGTTVYTVLAVHEALQDRADDVDGRAKDNPSELAGKRNASNPMSMTLLDSGLLGTVFNIDDTAAQFINFGSISQDSNDVLYSGLKTIGAPFVAGSPIYVVQNGVKLTKFWNDGHIQVMIKARSAGAFIDNGDVRAYSRKYGQTYADFAVNLAAGGETSAALSTSIDEDNSLSEIEAAALSTDISITVADVTEDLGNGNGPKLYKGTISAGGRSLLEVYNYLKYVTREGSTFSIGGVHGEQYRILQPGYSPVAASPLGLYAGGKLLLAQGWFLAGVLPSEAKQYQLIAHDGTTQAPPNVVGFELANTRAGDSILVAKVASEGGPINYNQYALAANNNIGNGTVAVKTMISADTPQIGVVRVDSDRYEYSSWSGAIFTLTGTLSKSYSEDDGVYVPLLDLFASGNTEGTTFVYSAPFRVSVVVRNNVLKIVPFITEQLVGENGASVTVIRTQDA